MELKGKNAIVTGGNRVIGLTFALAIQFAPYVTVNAIAPGPVDTELISSETKKKLSKKTPFGRIATTQEIAHSVIFLLENDYVSGEVVEVNAARYLLCDEVFRCAPFIQLTQRR